MAQATADPQPAAVAQRLRTEVPELKAGIGVAAGQVVAGNVGAKQRFEYTVIGEPVNEAARLCDFAADLAKVRATAPRIFDAAVISAHGRHKASTIIAQVVAAGCGKKLDGQFSKERLHKVYAQLRRMFA